jgi:SP family sugar:H+ symporter-like MFS transporter
MKSRKYLTVYFDEHRRESEKQDHDASVQPATDYSPLPRVTGRTFGMGILVSMGGMV